MAAKEAPSLAESVTRWAAIGVLVFGALKLAALALPLAVVNFITRSALVGGAVGAGIWATNKLVSIAKGPAKA
jgi:hypothetical protein